MKGNADMADEPEFQAPGAAPSFSYVIQRIQNGDLHAQLTAHLSEIAQALQQYVDDYKGAPKAALKLELKFKLDKGAVEITGTTSVTLPKAPAAGGYLWIDRNGRFTENHPSQMQLFATGGPRSVS